MSDDRRRDAGMTLTELVFVVGLVGLVSVVIAATFITILRVNPTTQFRIDDARSTRGLQTWLARDIASTPPTVYVVADRAGFVDASFASPASAGVPPADVCTTSGTHVLFMAWTDGGTSYRAQYTLEASGLDGFEVVRTVCGGDSRQLAVTGGVSNAVCASTPRSDANITDLDGDLVYEATINLCFVSQRLDDRISQGGQQQEITMSVVSRNGDT